MYDMFQDWFNMGKKEGKYEGRIEGRAAGIAEERAEADRRNMNVIRMLEKRNVDREVIAILKRELFAGSDETQK